MPRKKRSKIPEPEEPDLEGLSVEEPEPESVAHTEDRLDQIEKEFVKQEALKAEQEAKQQAYYAKQTAAARKVEEESLTKQASLVEPGETRDHLLDRIRQMREEPPANISPPPAPLSEGMKQQLTAEQEAGRAAVAKAEAAAETARKVREATAADQRAREGTMEPVRHPNPSQSEQFPANKATLGKTQK